MRIKGSGRAYDWRKWIELGMKSFPYKGLNDPEYINDRLALEVKHGNGWWVNDGRGWEMNAETHMERGRRYRANKSKKNQWEFVD